MRQEYTPVQGGQPEGLQCAATRGKAGSAPHPMVPYTFSRYAFFVVALLFTMGAPGSNAAPVTFANGDVVRLTRSETLLFKGEKFLGAPKGQEFTVLQHDWRRGIVYVPFFKEDGSLVAVTLPAEALEPGEPDGWGDLFQGVMAFREQRYEDAKRLLLRAAQDPQQGKLAVPIATRVNGAIAAAGQARANQAGAAKQAFLNTAQGIRDIAEQLSKLGHFSLALPLDEGIERLAVQALGNAQPSALPPSRLNRDDLSKRVAVSNRAVARCRQAVALHRLIEASRYVEEAEQMEPGRPDLKKLNAKVKRGIEDAEDSYKAANSMRRFEKGAIHALTALERGLKYCVDHPKLLALRNEMEGAWEERTAPQITPSLLTSAGGHSPKALEEGRHLYTTRCTECHDLELLDSRSVSGWRTAIAGMARRAGLDDAQQARILDYITVAQNGMETK